MHLEPTTQPRVDAQYILSVDGVTALFRSTDGVTAVGLDS